MQDQQRHNIQRNLRFFDQGQCFQADNYDYHNVGMEIAVPNTPFTISGAAIPRNEMENINACIQTMLLQLYECIWLRFRFIIQYRDLWRGDL